MVANKYIRGAIDYLVDCVGAVYDWKLTEKSLVYYEYGFEGCKGKRVVVPLSEVERYYYEVSKERRVA